MLRYFLLAAAVQLVWSLTPSASNYVIREMPVELYIAFRWTVSGLIFLVLSFAWPVPRGQRRLSVRAADLPVLMVLGIAAYGIASIATLHGLKIGGVVNFALLSAVNPLLAGAVAVVVLKEEVNRRTLMAAGVCVVGLLTLVLGKYRLSSLDVALGSAALVFGAYFLDALAFAFSKKVGRRVRLFEYLAVLQLSAGAFMWIAQLAHYRQYGDPGSYRWEVWAAALFVAVVACVLCYALQYWLLQRMEGHRLALFEGLHTVFGAIFGALIFHEAFNSWMIAGGVLLLGGLYLNMTGHGPEPPQRGTFRSFVRTVRAISYVAPKKGTPTCSRSSE